MKLRSLIAILCTSVASIASAADLFFDPCAYGAKPDGQALCTVPIQQAIDACAAAGGGTVRLSGGQFLSGSIILKSHVTLRVERGATLLGSPHPADYPDNPHAFPSRFTTAVGRCSLITAEKAEHVAIKGGGTIDGKGWGKEMKDLIAKGTGSFGDGTRGMRPLVLQFSECRHVRVRDILLKRSAFWMQNYLACEDVLIDGITVENVGIANTDGLDLDGCKDVRVANCRLIAYDDTLCLKSTSGRACENIVVTNCILSSKCNAIKTGTDSTGGFMNITISNCVIYDSGSGISLELVDGGKLERVIVSDINMHRVANPIFVRLGNRGRGQEKPMPGVLRNVIIHNVQADGVTNLTGCSITGVPGHPVENVTLENIGITFKGGGKREHVVRDVPEWPDRYPDFFMFTPESVAFVDMFKNKKAGPVPAYGFWVRHARNVRFAHLDLRFNQPDERPALFFDDVEDVKIFDLKAQNLDQTPALIWMQQTDGALISGCQARAKEASFLKVAGDRSRNIALIGNDLSRVHKPTAATAEVPEGALYIK